MTYLWVALGGALGSMARFAATTAAVRYFGPQFLWGTVLVNIAGCFAIGALAAIPTADGRPFVAGDLRAFLIVGVLGGFTTFSAFSLETLMLARAGHLADAGLNVAVSVFACLAAAAAGFYGVAALTR